MSRWRNFCITELADFCNAQRIPLSAMERAHKKGNFPYYGASGIVDYIDNYIFDGSYILISEDGENLKSRKTPIAFEATGKFWVNNHAHVLKAKKPHLTALIIQYFSQLDLSPYLTGAAQPKLNKASLNLIPLYLPIDESEQKAIASILSSLKDKIDLLHRQNKTLESMAETLFRQWLDNEQQDNLKEGKLSDIISLKYGKALKQENRSGEGFPVVASGGIVGFHNEYLVNAPGIVIGRKGTLGKVYYMYENFYPIDTSYYIESKIKNSKLFYEYFLLKSLGFENMNSDSAVPGLNRDSAMSSSITLPSFEMIINFNSFCEGFFNKIKINSTQVNTLENLRDTLLPKLMSGELRVQYAEEAIASVA